MLIRLLPFIIALAFAPSALAGGPTMQFGAAEDVVRTTDLPAAKAKMTLLRLAGFSSVRVTSQWQGTEATPSETELTVLRNVAGAAQLSAVRVYLSIYPTGSRVTPLTPEARELFAAYVTSLKQQLPSIKDVIIGNEPNINRFWLPQFGPGGSDVAAQTYTALLGRSYEAVKLVDPATRVWGGALAPRGIDRPGTGRDTHSPVAFLKDMGIAYRASGRTSPIMDGLADYDRLMRTLATAFDNSPQAGSLLPVLYDEFGVESKVPAGKASLYTGSEPATTRPVDEITQGAYYAKALQLAFCQPNVTGIFVFHTQDEPGLANWQSGLYYADGSPKSSIYAVHDALGRARGGSIARCPGLGLDVAATKVSFPTQAALASGTRNVRFTCTLDCRWELRVSAAASGVTRFKMVGYGRATRAIVVSLKGRKLGTGQVRFSITLTHPLNPGAPQTRESSTLSLH